MQKIVTCLLFLNAIISNAQTSYEDSLRYLSQNSYRITDCDFNSKIILLGEKHDYPGNSKIRIELITKLIDKHFKSIIITIEYPKTIEKHLNHYIEFGDVKSLEISLEKKIDKEDDMHFFQQLHNLKLDNPLIDFKIYCIDIATDKYNAVGNCLAYVNDDYPLNDSIKFIHKLVYLNRQLCTLDTYT